MKTVILAGGFGTRLTEETTIKPKPMVEIGDMPILWHIMKMYSAHGFNDFIICCGYKGYMIKEFFMHYLMRVSDVKFNLKKNKLELLDNKSEPWQVTLVDTGENTMTGGRIKRIEKYVKDETFFLTYGDGVSDVDFNILLDFHKQQNTSATLTAVQPPGRFGAFHLDAESSRIKSFREKPKGDSAWINGGFFVLEPEIFDYLENDETVWELGPMEHLAHDGKLAAYKHCEYWQNMDTLRDKAILDKEWNDGTAPWKKW